MKLYSVSALTGGATSSVSAPARPAPKRTVETTFQVDLSSGTATIAVQGTLDAQATWFVIKGGMTASEAFLGALADEYRVVVTSATDADIDVSVDLPDVSTRVDS